MSDKALKIRMLKKLRENIIRELCWLVNDKCVSLEGPSNDVVGVGVLQHGVQLEEKCGNGRFVEADGDWSWRRGCAGCDGRRIGVLWWGEMLVMSGGNVNEWCFVFGCQRMRNDERQMKTRRWTDRLRYLK